MIVKIANSDDLRLVEIWESAVRATHHFLKEEDFLFYKKQLPTYFRQVTLYGFKQDHTLVGFIGVAHSSLEMLFVENNHRGAGIGKRLATYAMTQLKVTEVDVNEQNTQAVGFYQHLGFRVVKRSALDGEGRGYPILHLQLEQ